MTDCKILQQSRYAHPPCPEGADNPVQPVADASADEHGLAVLDSGNLQEGGAVFFQRKPPLPAADTSGR